MQTVVANVEMVSNLIKQVTLSKTLPSISSMFMLNIQGVLLLVCRKNDKVPDPQIILTLRTFLMGFTM